MTVLRSTTTPDNQTTSFRSHALIAAGLGAVLAFVTLDPWFLLGVGAKWHNPTQDLTAYIVAATYYLRDGWHFPLYAVPQMGYPEGGSIIYNDAIPLAALPAKVLATLTGWRINYFGPWMLLCYVLQAVFAARLAFVLGNRSRIAAAAFAMFAVSCEAFILRLHIALAAQFVVYWALIAYLRARQPGARVARVVVPPLIVSFLVNPYLFAMVAPIVGVAMVSQWRTPAMRRQLVFTALGTAGFLAVVIVIGGYIPQHIRSDQFADVGFGYFSWNPASMFVPPANGIWTSVTSGIVRDATGGQYEGESYLGFAPLCLLLCWLWLRPDEPVALVRRHWLLSLLLAGFVLFALSDQAFVRSMTLWTITLPAALLKLASIFRTSGRFIWPVMYLLLIVPGVALAKRWPRPIWVGVMALAAALQFAETMPTRLWVRNWTASPSPDIVNTAVLSSLMRGHTRVWQYPSWFCGGLGKQARVGPLWREHQIQAMAAFAGLPTNSVYMSRPFKDCDREQEEAAALTTLQPDVLYIFAKDGVPGLPNLRALVSEPACHDLGWGWVCSRSGTSEQRSQPAESGGHHDSRGQS